MATNGQPGARGVALSVLAVLAAAVLVLAAVAVVRHEQGKPVAAPAPPSSTAHPRPSVQPARPARLTRSPTPTTAAPSPTPHSSHATHHPTPPPSSSTSSVRPAPAPAVVVGGHPTVVLDPGHNGGNASHLAQIDKPVPAGYGVDKPCNTTGTDTDSGYPEHAFTWDVARLVRDQLERHGVHVIMTRHSDDGVGPCVDERAAIESTPGVAAAVAIHADGASAAGHGFHICVDSKRPEGASAATVRRTKALDGDLLASLTSSSGLTRSTYIGDGSGYYYRDDLAGLNLSTNPTAFLELGNMRNSGDAADQDSAAGRARIADAVTAGILAYLAAR